MKAIVDTNVVVSGLIWPGPPAAVIDAATDKAFQLVTSGELIAELGDVLARPHLESRLRARGWTVNEVMARFRAISILADAADVEAPAGLRDLKDLPVLRCAVGAQAQAIVTGDKDLLVLNEFQGIQILTARLFLGVLGR